MLYPILTPSRLLIDLSGTWRFRADDGSGFAGEWYARELREPLHLPVPASYNDLTEDIALRDHSGWVFYQRPLALPPLPAGTRAVLRFDAVTHHARVYLNGELLTEHTGGFLPFEAELTGKLLPGDNLLTVAVSNRIDLTTLPVGTETPMIGGGSPRGSQPNFDFFNYAGITRPVRLYTTPASYLRDITLTPAISRNAAEIAYRLDVVGEGEALVEVFDREGNKVAAAAGTDGVLRLENVRLWEPLNAYLYDVKVRFGADEYTLPYGVRTVRVAGTQFLINEKPFYFKGYGKHEDTFPGGRGLNLPMNAKDISLMKWQGANSFRTSHYPYSEEMMRLCDEEGIVVIDETPAVGVNFMFGGGANFGGQRVRTFDPEHGVQTQAHHREVICELIARDKNHACVVMWSIANEPDSSAEGAYEYFEPLYRLARELDAEKRPCTLASVFSAHAGDDCSAKLSDVICLNRYYGWYNGGPDIAGAMKALRAELEEWRAIGKPVMFTEYGADTVAGLHDTAPVMYTEEYQVEYYEQNNAVLDEFDFIVGEQVWNFADFATSQSMLRVQGNRKGVFTRDRRPKLAAHCLRRRWRAIPDFGYRKQQAATGETRPENP